MRSPISPRLVLAAAAVLCAWLLACPQLQQATAAPAAVPLLAQPAPPRLIEVSGQARLDVPPDRVDLELTLEQKRPSPRLAVAELSRRRDALVSALRRSSVGGEDLVLSHVGLQQSFAPGPIRTPDGYLASVTLIATLRDPARIGLVMEAAAAAQVTRISSTMRTSKGPEMKKRVREMALHAAREKAAQIARNLGVKLGPVQQVRESQWESWYGGRWTLTNENAYASGPRGGGGGEQPERAPSPDAIPLILGLNVTFAIQ